MPGPKFKVKEGKDGQFYVSLFSGSEELQGSEGFKSKHYAMNGHVAKVRRAAKKATVEFIPYKGKKKK